MSSESALKSDLRKLDRLSRIYVYKMKVWALIEEMECLNSESINQNLKQFQIIDMVESPEEYSEHNP